MIKYGDTTVTDFTFIRFDPKLEQKPQWIDIHLKLYLADGQSFPDDLNDPGALIISTYDGEVIEYVVQNEGCDSEYQFTEAEKAQIGKYVKELVSKEKVNS